MVVDIHTRVGHWPFKKLRYNTCGELLKRMDRFGISRSVVSSMNGIFYSNAQSANEELYEELQSDRRFKDRFIPLAVLNPLYTSWEKDLLICHRQFGMRGVCVYPQYHNYDCSHPGLIELAQAARELGMAVAITARMMDNRQRSWMDIAKEWSLAEFIPLIEKVPDAKYLLLNLATGYRLNDQHMALLRNTDLLIDTSGRSLADMPEVIRLYGAEKIAMGSHSPVLDSLTGLLRIVSLSAGEADERTKQLMLSGNALSFFNLSSTK